MNEKLVLIGAGSAMFTRGLVADVLRQGWDGELALVDVDQEALEIAHKLTKKMIEAKASSLAVTATTDRRQALPGATSVICTIGVGGRRAWEVDAYIPRKYGIYQPVADSVMPGGSSRALRMIPAMVDVAKDVVDLAPDALFFNYGNPMSAICRGVNKGTGATMTGLCHGVNAIAGFIAHHLGATREQLTYKALGINHLIWFVKIAIDGEDAMPRLREVAVEKLGKALNVDQMGQRFAEAGTAAPDAVPETDNPFAWELTELFGAFPAVLDRHITEFFPHMFSRKGAYYGKTLGVDAYSVEQTIEHGDAIFADMRTHAPSPDPLPEDYFDEMSGEHEQVTEIIHSIRTDAKKEFSANLSNGGQVPNLPRHAVIECPAIAGADGLTPIQNDPMNSALVGTLADRFQWVETIVDAALECSREKFVQALLIDGSVDSVDTAYRLADELLAAQKQHLPEAWQ
ncbi:hypothetical protein ACFLQU_03045 [Verrucomicrobiota bacterium]